jgi:hypothetical protein
MAPDQAVCAELSLRPGCLFSDRWLTKNESGSRVAGALPSARLVMYDQVLLQFEVIRMIAASLIALAIAVAWLLVIGK